MFHSNQPYSASSPIGIRIVNGQGQSLNFTSLDFEADPAPATSIRPLKAYGAASLAAYSFAPIPSLPEGDYSVFECSADGHPVNGPVPIDSRRPRLPEAVGVFTGGTYPPAP
jgi:hypothetical protein